MTLHFGKGNVRTQYVMNGKVIASGKLFTVVKQHRMNLTHAVLHF